MTEYPEAFVSPKSYVQSMNGGRSKKSRRTRHKKRSFKRKLRKTRR